MPEQFCKCKKVLQRRAQPSKREKMVNIIKDNIKYLDNG